MNKMKKRLLIGCCVALMTGAFLGGILAYYIANYPYTNIAEANWGIVLPVGYEEVYGQATEASFHGDGIRYHVFQYDAGCMVEDVLAFCPTEGDTYRKGTYSEASELWLDDLGVPAEWRPDYEACSYYYQIEKSPDEVIFMWNSDEKKLHIVESFM